MNTQLTRSHKPVGVLCNVYRNQVRAAVPDNLEFGMIREVRKTVQLASDGKTVRDVVYRQGPLVEVMVETSRIMMVKKSNEVMVEKSRNNRQPGVKQWLRLLPVFDTD